MYISIRVDVDPLAFEIWGFLLERTSSGTCTLALDCYSRESRRSKRHKWTIAAWWDRTKLRDSTCARPEVSPAVAAEARWRLCNMVKGAEVS